MLAEKFSIAQARPRHYRTRVKERLRFMANGERKTSTTKSLMEHP